MSHETEPQDLTPETPQEKPKEDPIDQLIKGLSEHKFTRKSLEYPITIEDKDGKPEKFILRELGAEAREEYMNFQAQKAKYGADGKVTGIKDIKGLEIKLVAASLFDLKGANVNEQVIRATFPGSLTKQLASIAARISGLDEKAEDRAKNS